MIIRIRTNLRTLKEDVPASSTLKELMKIICDKLLIDTPSNEFTLSKDIFGKHIIESSANETLEQLNLQHGDEIHVLDRFEHYTIEKDYINDNHELIKAGKRAKVSEFYNESNKAQKPILVQKDLPSNTTQSATKLETASTNDSPKRNTNEISNLPPPEQSLSFQPSNIDPRDSSAVNSIQTDDEIDIRVPDEIQMVRLIEPMSPALRRPELTSEDYRQLHLLRKQLLDAGLLKDEVELQVEEETNRILSERAINQLRLEDRLGSTFGTMSTLDELEALLLTRRTNRFPTISVGTTTAHQSNNSQAFRQKFSDRLLQQTGQNMISNPSLPISNADSNSNISHRNSTNHANETAQPSRIKSKPSANQRIPPHASPQLIITNNVSKGTNTNTSTFNEICQNGSGLVQAKNSKHAVVSNLPSIRGDKGNSNARNKSLVTSNTSSNASNIMPLEGQSNKPSVRISPRPPLAPPSQGQKQRAVAAIPNTSDLVGMSSAPNSARSNSSSSSTSSARQAVRRRSHQSDSQQQQLHQPPPTSITNNDNHRTSSNSRNNPSHPAEQRKQRQEELLQSKAALEANIDLRLQQGQPRRPSIPKADASASTTVAASTTDSSVSHTASASSTNNERNVALMRRFLQHPSPVNAESATGSDTSLPAWLQRDIHTDIDDQLLQLAQKESRAMMSVNNRRIPLSSEDEDEALAKALQASLDEY